MTGSTGDYHTTDLRPGHTTSNEVTDQILKSRRDHILDVLGRRWFAVPRTALELEFGASERAELMNYYQVGFSTPATAVFTIHIGTFAKMPKDAQDWLDGFSTTREDVAREMTVTRDESKPTYATQQADEATRVRITMLEKQLTWLHLAARQLAGLWLSGAASDTEESQIRAWLRDKDLGDPIMPTMQRVTFTARVTFTVDEEVFDAPDVRSRKLYEVWLDRAFEDVDIIPVEYSADEESITVEPIPLEEHTPPAPALAPELAHLGVAR